MRLDSAACPALSLAFSGAASVYVCVGKIVRVPPFTELLKRISSFGIFACGYRLHVVWIHARFIFAKMVYGQAVGNFPANQFKRKSVRSNRFGRPLRYGKRSVTFGFGTSPNPTVVRFLNVSPESFWNPTKSWRRHRVAVPVPSRVVFSAQTPTNAPSIAPLNRTVCNWPRHLHMIIPHL